MATDEAKTDDAKTIDADAIKERIEVTGNRLNQVAAELQALDRRRAQLTVESQKLRGSIETLIALRDTIAPESPAK